MPAPTDRPTADRPADRTLAARDERAADRATADPRAAAAPRKITLRVTTALGIETRRRRGFQFGTKPIVIHATPEQAAAIKADTGLVALSVGDGGDVAMSDELAHAIAEADHWKGEAVRTRAHLNAAIDQMQTAGLEYTPPPDVNPGTVDLGALGLDFEDENASAGDALGAAKGTRQPRPPRDGGIRAAAGRIPLDGPGAPKG